jgi:GT2 family glycosyltransferase
VKALSIVVASRDRPLRLRWLLNALADQTLDRGLWEVVVCHDSTGRETDELLASHPLALEGVLRSARHNRRTAGAGRNLGVEMASAPTVVFTDDDCRPPSNWLANVWDAVQRHPGAIIQGPVEGDPDESAMRRAPYPRTVSFTAVPTPWAECCNIVYPRELVQRVGGFADDVDSCEDTDLNVRARRAGPRYVGAPRMLTYHAIDDGGVGAWVRSSRRWRFVPWLLGRHPELRRQITLGIFWKREHLFLLGAIWGLSSARRKPLRLLLAVPWALSRGTHGPGARGRLRDLTELPGWAAIDAAELLALLQGSVEHRTLVL